MLGEEAIDPDRPDRPLERLGLRGVRAVGVRVGVVSVGVGIVGIRVGGVGSVGVVVTGQWSSTADAQDLVVRQRVVLCSSIVSPFGRRCAREVTRASVLSCPHGARPAFDLLDLRRSTRTTSEIGVAVQSKYFAVGAVVPWAAARVGAVATQAAGIAGYGPLLLTELGARCRSGRTRSGRARRRTEGARRGSSASLPQTALGGLDRQRVQRVGRTRNGRRLRGAGQHPRRGGCVADLPRRSARTGRLARGAARRRARSGAGGRRRQPRPAVGLGLRRAFGAGMETGELVDRVVDLRVDDHEQPIVELRRLLELDLRWDHLKERTAAIEAGRLVAAADALRIGLAAYPDDATVLYDLGCYEALTGHLDDALGHIRPRARAGAIVARRSLPRDSDLDPLRERGDTF